MKGKSFNKPYSVYFSAKGNFFAEAIQFFSKHLEIQPDNGEALFRRALCHANLSNLEAALQVRGVRGAWPGLGEEQGD